MFGARNRRTEGRELESWLAIAEHELKPRIGMVTFSFYVKAMLSFQQGYNLRQGECWVVKRSKRHSLCTSEIMLVICKSLGLKHKILDASGFCLYLCTDISVDVPSYTAARCGKLIKNQFKIVIHRDGFPTISCQPSNWGKWYVKLILLATLSLPHYMSNLVIYFIMCYMLKYYGASVLQHSMHLK